MVRTRSASMAKGKAKLCQPPTRASPRLAALRSNTVVQTPTQAPVNPVKETATSTIPPKKRQNFRMAGESSSRRDTRTPCRWSRRLAALLMRNKLIDSIAWSFIPRGNDTHFTVVLLVRFGALAEIGAYQVFGAVSGE
ncbi:hypothetical protein PIB30_085671 [Stylosanthes scabra]|uniref:Uncharacterized protein n=1 Tax=Stylosanthes scabra TaxID=79078 RepID=A0ABU6RSS8_9FABA|nr:hypothetical protein [Stylosanthes scabra]